MSAMHKPGVQRNDRWKYVGDAPSVAKGSLYTVLEVKRGIVQAMSDALPGDLASDNVAGFSWAGPMSEFLRDFVRA